LTIKFICDFISILV